MLIKRFHHLKIDVGDLGRSLEFYCTLLGLSQIVRYDRDDGITIVQVGPDGQAPGLELWYEPPHRAYASERVHFAFEVDDLAAAVARLDAFGWPLAREPFRMGDERLAFVQDPDGYLIELYEFSQT